MPVLLLCGPFCQADPPSGALSYSLTNRLWDLTGSYALNCAFRGAGGKLITSSYGVEIGQDGRGFLRGAGQNILILVGNVPFAASYTAKGKVTRSHGVSRAVLEVRLYGDTDLIPGRLTHFRITAVYKVTQFDPASGVLRGTVRANANFPGIGGGSATTDFSAPLPGGMDGTWNLNLNVIPFRTLGGNATVTLSNGRTLDFSLKGHYSSGSDTSKLKLTGAGDSRGSVLKLILDGNQNITYNGLKGRVMSQKLP